MRKTIAALSGRPRTYRAIANVETLEPRRMLAATLPAELLFQDGYSDVFVNEFTPTLMQNFTMIGGSTANAGLVNQLRSQGKLFLYNVSYNPSLTASQLAAQWAVPFNNTLGGQLAGGFDGIEIDEVLSWPNGSADSVKFISALQQLRSQYPNKVIAPYTALPTSAAYSNIWNAINTHADINLYEAYLRENNPGFDYFPQVAADLDSVAPGILNKTVFTLFSAQAGDPGDGSTNVGFLGFLDEQMHTIRNDALASQARGVGSYVYSQPLTTDYMGRAMDHYFVQNNTAYFGDGDYAQDVANPSFESNTNGWTLTPGGGGGTVARVGYSGTGISTTHDAFGQTSHGNFAVRTVRGSSGAGNQAAYTLNVTPGQSYAVSAFVAAGGSGNPNSAKVRITTTSGTPIAEKGVFDLSQINNVPPWKRIIFNFQVPAGVTQVNLVLADESVPAGTTLYWDFIEFEDSVPLSSNSGGPGGTLDVVRENFQDDTAGPWLSNTGNAPQSNGRPGQWVPSGHVANDNPTNPNLDFDWGPLVQDQIGAGLTLPTGEYVANKNLTGSQTGTAGVFNMDGILRFTLADGTPRPAVAGDKIVGSFDYYQQSGTLGFGFTDNIAALQAYQAAMPDWTANTPAPLMMPTAYNDLEGTTRVGISPNISGHISIASGSNNLYTHAVVDTFENGGAGDGFVDQGNLAPKTNPNSTANRPLNPNLATQTIRFEYTIGNSTYDVLQVDHDGPSGPAGFVNILQAPTGTPNPNGPMPVGKVLGAVQGMFITGSSGQTTEVWYDNIHVYLEPAADVVGDFNDDGIVDAADIDLLTAAIRNGGPADPYDVNGDTLLNKADLKYHITTILGTLMGDTDLDGDVDEDDLNTLGANYKTSPRGWADGNFDTDQDVDLVDLTMLATYYGQSAPAPAQTTAAPATDDSPPVTWRSAGDVTKTTTRPRWLSEQSRGALTLSRKPILPSWFSPRATRSKLSHTARNEKEDSSRDGTLTTLTTKTTLQKTTMTTMFSDVLSRVRKSSHA